MLEAVLDTKEVSPATPPARYSWIAVARTGQKAQRSAEPTSIHSMTLPGNIPGPYARLLDEYLERLGVTAIPPVEPELERLPMQEWHDRLEQAAELLHDPELGLHLGQTIRLSHFGVLGYLFHACGTLGGALSRLEKYQRLAYDFNPMQVAMSTSQIELIWSTDQGLPGRRVDECAIAALITLARALVVTPANPLRIQFVNPAPAADKLAEFTQFFGCPVIFAASDTRVVLPPWLIAEPLCNPDEGLRDLLEKQAEVMLQNLPQEDDLARQVSLKLARALPSGPPSQAEIACALGMSTRSLHRTLARNGLQYRELLARTRYQLANQYLADPRLQLAEVAQLCGYSEQSAFTRAYKSWAGTTPRQARKA